MEDFIYYYLFPGFLTLFLIGLFIGCIFLIYYKFREFINNEKEQKRIKKIAKEKEKKDKSVASRSPRKYLKDNEKNKLLLEYFKEIKEITHRSPTKAFQNIYNISTEDLDIEVIKMQILEEMIKNNKNYTDDLTAYLCNLYYDEGYYSKFKKLWLKKNLSYVDSEKYDILFYIGLEKDDLTCDNCKNNQYILAERKDIKEVYKKHIDSCNNQICRCHISSLENSSSPKEEVLRFIKNKDTKKYKYKCPFCGSKMGKPKIINQPAGYYEATQYFIFCECKKCKASFSQFLGEY